MDSIPGGIVAPDGFRMVSVHSGVKHKRSDLRARSQPRLMR